MQGRARKTLAVVAIVLLLLRFTQNTLSSPVRRMRGTPAYTVSLCLCSQYLNRQRTAPCLDEMPTILYNMSVYLECVPLETGGALYGPLVPQLDVLLHRLLPCLAALPELDSLLAIMCSVLKIPNVNMYKVGRCCNKRLFKTEIPLMRSSKTSGEGEGIS